MPRLSKAQTEARRKIERLAERKLPAAALARQLLQALLIAIPADHAMIFGVDPATHLFNRLLAYMGAGIALYRRWLQTIYLCGEPAYEVTFPGLIDAGLDAVAIRDGRERSWGFPAGYFSGFARGEFGRACRAIVTPAGGILRAHFCFHGHVVAALEMGRLDPDYPVKATDAAFLGFLAPRIGELLGAALARVRARANPDPDGLPPTAVVLLEEDGRVGLRTPAVDRWFAAVEDSPALLSGTDGVPTAIWAATAALRAGFGRSQRAAALIVPTALGPVRVEAVAAGANGSAAVTLTPARPAYPPPLPWWWPLTPAERKVLVLVVRGLSNAEIATALVLSESTVETHLRHAYRKLQVSSRTAFLARLLEEVY